jgi:hypothetical protein
LPLGRFAAPSEKVMVDIRLDEVVLRSLAKEPQRRYQQASEVKTDVEHISHSPPPAALAKVAASSPPPPVDLEEARAQVRGPAIGLLVTGIIHCALFPLIFLMILGFFGFSSLSVQKAPYVEEFRHDLPEPAPDHGDSSERITRPQSEH